ncbi:MAG: peptidylprolyl isomerase [Candidatus Solibacter usitatus]|nr:peptidylprolyl isomerase [Candidatus Solibacter usitatus]
MKPVLLTFAVTIVLTAQATKPELPELGPDTVVAMVGGRKITSADVDKILMSMPPSVRLNYEKSPQGFLSTYFLLSKLVEEAEKTKIAEQDHIKKVLEYQRTTTLAQLFIEERSRTTIVSKEELQRAYEARKSEFTEAKVKIIYIPFVSGAAASVAGAAKSMTEPQALAKAEGVVKKAKAGADFEKLVEENSEDPVSKGKKGDFGPVKKADKLPDAIKMAVFSLKVGEVSDPVRQPNGYYILKLMELTAQSYDDLSETLFRDARDAKVREWMDGISKATQVKVQREDFFARDPKK